MNFLTYDDIVEINIWCQKLSEDKISITYGIKENNLLRSIPLSVKQVYEDIELYPSIYDKAS